MFALWFAAELNPVGTTVPGGVGGDIDAARSARTIRSPAWMPAGAVMVVDVLVADACCATAVRTDGPTAAATAGKHPGKNDIRAPQRASGWRLYSLSRTELR